MQTPELFFQVIDPDRAGHFFAISDIVEILALRDGGWGAVTRTDGTWPISQATASRLVGVHTVERLARASVRAACAAAFAVPTPHPEQHPERPRKFFPHQEEKLSTQHPEQTPERHYAPPRAAAQPNQTHPNV